MWVRRIVVALTAMVAVACTACEPAPIVTPNYPPQTEGTIHLEGDSVTFNTYWMTGISTFHTYGNFDPGSSADYNPYGEAAIDRVPEALADGTVDNLVWALGLNEIYRAADHLWTVKDQLIWTDLLQNKVPDESCVVIVKPWVLPANYIVRPLASMNALRSWIDKFASDNSNVVLVDWKPILEASPQYSAIDGVHLDPDTGAAEARDAMMREGLTRCG